MRSAVDTNIISAIWSQEASAAMLSQLLGEAKREGSLVISAVVFAELLAYPRVTEKMVYSFLDDTGVEVDFAITSSMWIEAGRRFAMYCERRRTHKMDTEPRRLVADYLVGSHALASADRLIINDSRRYVQDFPELPLVGSV